MPQKCEKCAYCHAILFEDDDVVYCPECGAPHHRDCYNQLGECANKERHGLEPEEEPQQEVEQEAPKEERPEGIPFDRDGHICARCGKRSTSDTLFCPYCGTPFVEAGQYKGNFAGGVYTSMPNMDPYGGVNPNEVIDNHTVSEIASYVKFSTHRYIPIFKKQNDLNKKTGWNWAAFLLTYIWLFFRKCYREGFVVVLFTLLATIMQAPWTISAYAYLEANGLVVESLLQRTSEAYEHLTALSQSIPMIAWLLYILGGVIFLILHVVLGIYGDNFYKKRVAIKLTQIKEDPKYTDKTAAITTVGGCNIFSAAAIMYGMNFVSSLILTFFS